MSRHATAGYCAACRDIDEGRAAATCHECGSANVTRGVTFLGDPQERCGDCPAFTYWDRTGMRWNVTARCVRFMRGDPPPAAQRGTVDVGAATVAP